MIKKTMRAKDMEDVKSYHDESFKLVLSLK